MSRKLSAVLIFVALAMGVLLLFGLGDDASATTFKLDYSTGYDCGGADDNEGTPADNSCAAGTGRNLSSTADVETIFDIKVGHSNYANTRTVLASPAFNIAMDPSIPNGAFVGYLTTTATISLLGGPCGTQVPVTIPFFDASTDITNTIDWVGDGSNLTQDSDGNGLADGIDKYPSFLNIMFNGQKPIARYYGYTVPTGTIPTQLNFVIFAPGVLQGTSTAPGMPKPDQEINASLGYINYVALNNPAPGQPAAPSSITDLCTPLNVTTRLLGKTAGEGQTIPPVGNPELSPQCAGAMLGQDNDGDGATKEGGGSCNDGNDNDNDGKTDCADSDCRPYCDDGCIVVTDKCGDNIDNDGDTKTDEYCVNATGLYAARTRSTNPSSATSGIYGTGTHLAGAYAQGGRDADADGIENALDSCPTIADGRESGAACANAVDDDGDTKVNDGCPRVGTAEVFPTPDQCADATDNDSDGAVNDGCPPVQVDADGDGLGGAVGCDPNDASANSDQDGDTFLNRQDNCPLTANADQLDTDSNRCNDAVNSDAGDEAPTRINDGCPAVGAAETACTDATDSDGDTVVNDGCPLRGGISEFAVIAKDPNIGVNDGCAASGAAESGAQCDNNTDDDADTVVNDGCPTVGARKDCDSSVPADGDCVDTGEAAACTNALDDDGDAPNDFGPANDSIGNACDGPPDNPGASPTAVNGDYDKDFPRVAVCIGAADGDGDGWCDDTETALGSNPASAVSVPEYTGIDYTIDPAPQSCSNKQWYASSGDAIGDGAPIDDDGDTLVNTTGGKINDGCPADGAAETACDDVIDNDGDTKVNDGCPQVAAVAETVCDDVADSDSPDDADPGCAPLASDADQDGVADASDNCPNDYNPDQTNSDTMAIGGGDAQGDACDLNDDGDGLTDDKEWARGSDTRNPFSPFFLDLNGDTSVTGADASALKAWIGTSVATVPMPTQVCLP